MQIPGYSIDKQIGRGGMASVYLARHLGLDRLVAIKVMHSYILDVDSSYSDRFMREARIVANLSHQNIVTVYDVGVYDDNHYIAMEYLPGGITLHSKLKDGLDIQTGISAIKQIAAALSFAHGKGIVHRDVKPDNIIFRENGSAVLADFGIARAVDSGTKMTATRAMLGTPNYMSPEQAQGKKVGSFSDVYSLGIVFFEVLTGKVPYDSNSTIGTALKHVTEPIPELEGELKIYQSVINRMMAKTPEERYQNCDEIIADLDNIELSNDATVLNKASISDATVVKRVSHLNTVTHSYEIKNSASNLVPKGNAKIITTVLSLVILSAVGFGGYLYVQQLNKAELLVQQEKERLQAQQLKQDNVQELAKQRKRDEELMQVELKAKQVEQRRLAILRKQKEERQLSAQKAKAEKLLAERQAAAKKAAITKAGKERQKKIASLLASAEQQLRNNQLSKAYATYKQVLKLDSDNQRAISDIPRVADKYLVMANTAANRNEFSKAKKYVNSAIRIDPKNSKLADVQKKIYGLERKHKARLAEDKLLAEEAARKQQVPEKTVEIKLESESEPERKTRRSFGGF